MHGVGDRRRRPGQADLAHAARAQPVQLEVGIVEEADVQVRDVGMGGHDVVGEVGVHRRAAAVVVLGAFEQGHADPHHHRPLDLVARGQGIDDAAPVDYGDHP